MDTESLVEHVCRAYCAYYKPSGNEDLACKGFSVIEHLVRSGRTIRFTRSAKPLEKKTAEMLARALCAGCEFRENDCDYAAGTSEAGPCGGFVCLGHLIREGEVSIDEIMRAASSSR